MDIHYAPDNKHNPHTLQGDAWMIRRLALESCSTVCLAALGWSDMEVTALGRLHVHVHATPSSRHCHWHAEDTRTSQPNTALFLLVLGNMPRPW